MASMNSCKLRARVAGTTVAPEGAPSPAGRGSQVEHAPPDRPGEVPDRAGREAREQGSVGRPEAEQPVLSLELPAPELAEVPF